MKVAVVGGAGGVGSSVAFNLLRLDDSHDVVLLDREPRMIGSHVMDVEQSRLLGSEGRGPRGRGRRRPRRRHLRAHGSGRTSTWTSGLGVARMLEAIAGGDDAAWPASIRLAGEYGLEDVCLSVPVTLGRGGVEVVHEWELADDELEALHASAAAVRQAGAAIGAAG